MPDKLPWSRESEIELLAAPFVDGRVLDEVGDIIGPDDFFNALHQTLHQAQVNVWRARGVVDRPLVIAELDRLGITGERQADLLGVVFATAGTTGNARSYAEVVRDRATLRRMIDASQAIIQGAQAIPEDVNDFCCTSEGSLRTVAERGVSGMIEGADQGVNKALEYIHLAKSGDQSALGLQTGFRRLNHETAGLPRGMTIVMGRSGNGKSAFALQVARRVAERGHGVFIWSGEMPSEKVWARLFGCVSRYCIRDLFTTKPIEPGQWQRVQNAAHHVSTLPIELDCQPGLTAEQVCVRAQRARRKLESKGFKLRLVVVDHFNLLNHKMGRNEKEGSAMGRSSLCFANWAKGAQLTLLNLTQLNRESTKRGDMRPRMSDVRECGKIEEDAELMLGMYVAQKHDQTARTGEAEVVLCKNRMGRECSIPFHFDGPPNRFIERE